MKRLQLLTSLLLCAIAVPAFAQQNSIVQSKHNLSAGSMNSIRASSEEEICIFCHTPHNSAPIQPLWNRNIPVSAYTVYASNSLSAIPGQPTGSSKLCLSCHDGTIALGSVLSTSRMSSPSLVISAWRTRTSEMSSGIEISGCLGIENHPSERVRVCEIVPHSGSGGAKKHSMIY